MAQPQCRRSSSFIGNVPPTPPKVHCPKADRNVEKQHHMMNPRAESVVGGTVGAHAKKAHHHERRGPHTMSKPSVAPPTPNQQLLLGRHMLIRPPQHDTWPGKKTIYCLGLLYMPIYRPQHYIESLLCHGTPPTPDADPTAPPYGTYSLRERTHGPVPRETCVVAVVATW